MVTPWLKHDVALILPWAHYGHPIVSPWTHDGHTLVSPDHGGWWWFHYATTTLVAPPMVHPPWPERLTMPSPWFWRRSGSRRCSERKASASVASRNAKRPRPWTESQKNPNVAGPQPPLVEDVSKTTQEHVRPHPTCSSHISPGDVAVYSIHRRRSGHACIVMPPRHRRMLELLSYVLAARLFEQDRIQHGGLRTPAQYSGIAAYGQCYGILHGLLWWNGLQA